jgi:hypothetical protein
MELELEGDWVPSTDSNRRWSGTIRANRSFVALLVATAGVRLFWGKTEVCQSPLSITLHLHPLRSPLDIQPILMVGDGYIQEVTATLPSAESAIRTCFRARPQAGILEQAFVIPSEPPTNLGILLLARDDVHVGRSGVWRPKPAVGALLPPNLSIPLSGGRKGFVDVEGTPGAV